jgi:hypothetical protein
MGKRTTVIRTEEGDRPVPELMERRRSENGLEDAWTAFRRLAAGCYQLIQEELRHVRASGGGVTVVKRRPPEITKLSIDDVLERLASFERAYAATTGERLSSEDFYARFTAGHFDDRFGARWATFYEAAQITQNRDRTAAATA